MIWLSIAFVVLFLILIDALYVAAEIGAVGSRRSRLARMAGEGNRLAQVVLDIVQDPRRLDTYIAACQLGITLSSLALGFYGQAVVAPALAPYLLSWGWASELVVSSLTATGVLIFLTTLQVLLGELSPKTIGLQYPERTALLTVVPVRWSLVLFRPLIWLFNGSGRLLLRLLGFSAVAESAHVHTPEEILMLVRESGAGGVLDPAERELLENTLQLRSRPVRQAMVPRTQILAAPVDTPVPDLFTQLACSPYSRMPLYQGTIDNIVGVVHLKDLMCAVARERPVTAQELMRTPPYIPDTVPVEEVFTLLQREHYHMAVVIDEFGGTAGIVTFEDILEEIFGDIYDEFDVDRHPIQIVPDRGLRVDGDVTLADLNALLGELLPEEEADTVGGLIQSRLGRVPRKGDTVVVAGYTFQVEEMDGRAVEQVLISLPPDRLAQVQKALR